MAAPNPAVYSRTILQVKIGAGYAEIPGITSLSGPSFSKEIVDVTNMSSTQKEYKTALMSDAGELSFSMLYNPSASNATHSYVVSQSANSVTGNDLFKIVFSDNTTWGFTGSFSGFDLKADNPAGGMLNADVKVKLTGAVGFTG